MAFFNPPAGKTCGEFAEAFVNRAGGYINNPSDDSNCGYCSFSNADEYLLTIGAKFSLRWRNVGFFFAYIIFNLGFCMCLYYLLRYSKLTNKVTGFFAGLKKNKK